MAPATRSAVYAAEDAATNAEIPSTEATAQNRIPVEFPSTVRKAERLPWTAAERTTRAVAGPGSKDTKTATPTNDRRVEITPHSVRPRRYTERQIRPPESDLKHECPRSSTSA